MDDPAFIQWYRDLENSFDKENWNTSLSGDTLKIKVDQNTWIFNKNKEIDESDLTDNRFQGYTIKCIIEISGVYFFKDMYGFLMRAYQLMYIEDCVEECQIDLSV